MRLQTGVFGGNVPVQQAIDLHHFCRSGPAQVSVIRRIRWTLKIRVSVVRFRPRPPRISKADKHLDESPGQFAGRGFSTDHVPFLQSCRLTRAVCRVGPRCVLVSGARQGGCRLSHAANGCLSSFFRCSATTASRSGLRVTAPTGDQSRVLPDQRAGLRSRASWYSA